MKSMLRGLRELVVRLALLVALALPVYFAGAALGSKYGLWDWRFGLGVLTIEWGPIVLMASAALGLTAVLFAFGVRPRAMRLAALLALAVPAAALIYAGHLRIVAQSVPPIHDISTDWQDPPLFSAQTMVLRGPQANPLLGPDDPVPESEITQKVAGMTLGQIQAEAYRDIEPIELEADRAAALSAATDVLAAMGLEIVQRDEVLGTVEAVDTSFWFGFKDDVIVRVRPSSGGGSLVDVRSVSRIGISDLGANAKRVRTFRAKLLRIIT